jgi:hypothetical protein
MLDGSLHRFIQGPSHTRTRFIASPIASCPAITRRPRSQVISGDLKRDYPTLEILRAVHDGFLDAGFVRADNIVQAALANKTSQSYFKILGQLQVAISCY